MTPRSRILVTALVAAGALALAFGPTLAQGWGGGPGWGMGQGQGQGQGRGMGMGQGRGMNNPDAPWRVRFDSLDENHDGFVSRDELRSNASGVFDAMDGNGDDQLTLEEYKSVRMGAQRGLNPDRQAMMQSRKVARFAPMDTNRDGKVSRAEFLTAHGEAMFTQLDGDRDGRVSPVEFRRRGW